MKLSNRIRSVIKAFAFVAIAGLITAEIAEAKPVIKSKGGTQTPQIFRRQRNTMSNMDFYFTNRGVLFNNSGSAGLNWPRGTAQSYIFGEGLWFATKKVIGGKRRKLCELGYNPNSGAGWFIEGEWSQTDGRVIGDYKSFVSSRYSEEGKFVGTPDPNSDPWPIWDTAESKTLNQNFYFGDLISDVGSRVKTTLANGKETKPAMLSQEDIVNIYTDADPAQNPEFKPNAGYPFYINITEVIYSWSFGRYRDMIFIRHKVKNASNDTLYECFMAPAFDPDLGEGGSAAANDHNRYVDEADTVITKRVLRGTCFERDPRRLNMALQYSDVEKGKEYGVIGFSFLESPVIDANGEVRDLSDSTTVGGYHPRNPDYSAPLGLSTFKKWQIQNDPPTGDLRYDFCSDGSRDGDNTTGLDVRLLFSTGPFTLPPQRTVETVVGIAIAQASTSDRAKNIDSLFKLMAFAHEVFGGDCYGKEGMVIVDVDSTKDTSYTMVHKHFASPTPPDIPTLTVTCLDRAMLVEWDNEAELSVDPLSPKSLPFNTYELYRTTRSDFDSTIRPDGTNPVVKLGSWSLYDFRQDSIIQGGKFVGFRNVRKNSTPNPIPHSFLDIGDDNKDGVLSSTSEGLLNNVKYYYFIIATDEFDSVNNVGPLSTAVVPPKNFVAGIPCKPVFPDLPPKLTTDGKPCFAGEDMGATPPVSGIKEVALNVIDTGKFLQYYANDEVLVSFQPRWVEFGQQALDQSYMEMYMDVRDTKTGLNLTYDRLSDPNNTPTAQPYFFQTGLTQDVIGQKADSLVKGKFTTDNNNFTPYQRIDQAFSIIADYEFTQLKDPYKLKSITGLGGKSRIVRLSQRTMRTQAGDPAFDLADLGTGDNNHTNPSFVGSLGEVSYKVKFGPQEDMNETEYDTATKSTVNINSIVHSGSGTEFRPRPMRVTVTSNTHCDNVLSVVRENTRNDITPEFDYRYYTIHQPAQQNPALRFPTFVDPDTMLVPIPGKFTIDAFHYVDDDATTHTAPEFVMKTSGNYYYPGVTSVGNKHHFVIHRLRLAGAEIIMNAADYPDKSVTGDTAALDGVQISPDFAEGDNFDVNFTGQAKGLPFPGAQFRIQTSPNQPVDFNNQNLYSQQKILDQVQVVPNPYIVSHLGQSTTDNAKLFFTRLPPRATIEIYTISGDLVKTIEHQGYERNEDGSYNYGALADRYNTAEWNILSEGRQRVGSQVLIARVIAKDPSSGNVLGETKVKFAVVLGGYRQVVR